MTTARDIRPDAALYQATSKEMLGRLRAAQKPEDILAALRWGQAELDRTYRHTDKKILATVACRAGCAFCCSTNLGVQAHEVFLAADHLQQNFSPEQLAEVIARTAVRHSLVTTLTPEQYFNLVQPCPLLRDLRCSIYEARPEVCRAHHATDPKACEALFDPTSPPRPGTVVPALRARLFGVMLGLDQAVAEFGLDGRTYDFGAALHEALTDSLRVVLWLQGRPAFSDACREPPMQPGLVRGELRPHQTRPTPA